MESLNGTTAGLVDSGREEDVISGDCLTAKLPFLEAEGLRFGVWQCTTGQWRSSWKSWEYFTVLSGRGQLVDDDGVVHTLEPGVSVMIPAGSTGVWTLVEPLRKAYVAPGHSEVPIALNDH